MLWAILIWSMFAFLRFWIRLQSESKLPPEPAEATAMGPRQGLPPPVPNPLAKPEPKPPTPAAPPVAPPAAPTVATAPAPAPAEVASVLFETQYRYLMIFVWYCTAGIGLKQFSNVKDMADSPIGWCHLYSHQIGLWGRQCRPKLWLQCSRCDCDEHGKTTTTQVTGKPVASPLHVRFGVGAYAM